MSNFVNWMDKLYPGFAAAYNEAGNDIPDALYSSARAVPAGIGYNTALMLERIPLRAAIWDLKPNSVLAKRLGDMLTEVWYDDDNLHTVSLLASDSSLVGKDSLFLIVATALYWDDMMHSDFAKIPKKWYSEHAKTPRMISGSTTYVDPDGNTRRMAVMALQLSSYK